MEDDHTVELRSLTSLKTYGDIAFRVCVGKLYDTAATTCRYFHCCPINYHFQWAEFVTDSRQKFQLRPKRRLLLSSLLCVGHLGNFTEPDLNLGKARTSSKSPYLVERHRHHFDDGRQSTHAP